jgi:hypothetical protein
LQSTLFKCPGSGYVERYCDEAALEACCERLGCAVNVNPVEEPPRLHRVLCLEPQAGGLTMIKTGTQCFEENGR